MRLHRAAIYSDLFDAEVVKGCLVAIRLFVQGNTDLINNLMTPFFLNRRLDQSCLAADHIVLTQNIFDGLNTSLNGSLIICRTVLAQEVLQHVGRNDRVALNRFDEILADHVPREMLIDFGVEITHASVP